MTGDGGGPEGKRSSERYASPTLSCEASARARNARSAGLRRSVRSAGSLRVAALGLSVVIAGCAASATQWPVKPAAAPETATRPPADGPRMRIVDLEEYASEAPGWVVVVGTLENGGRSTTEELRITVNALGPGDRVVTSSPAIARSQHVAPHGRTSFAAVFAQLAEVEAYHVKVLAW
jgi:hypothetical protein